MYEPFNFDSRHFTLYRLAENAFAAVAKEGGAAVSNAGLVNLGGQILVFDTFLTPQAALDLRRFSEMCFGRSPQVVVNSHYHNDHIWGNQVFPEAQILSSARTRELITTEGMEEYRWYSANAAQRLEALRAQSQPDLWLGYYEGLVEAFPTLTVCLPGVTFDRKLEIHGSRLRCELFTFEGGHTASDTILSLPVYGIVFMSDLLFVDSHPYLGDGDPWKLLDALWDALQLKASCYVPGHGRVGTARDVRQMIDYIERCVDTAQWLVNSGNASQEQIEQLPVPSPFQNWQMPQFYRSNIKFLCGRLNTDR